MKGANIFLFLSPWCMLMGEVTTLKITHQSRCTSLYQAPSQDAPGLPPPTGQMSRFQDAYTLGPLYTLTMAQCLILTTCLVAARFYTKARIVKKLTWEDLTCLTWILSLCGILSSLSVCQSTWCRNSSVGYSLERRSILL